MALQTKPAVGVMAYWRALRKHWLALITGAVVTYTTLALGWWGWFLNPLGWCLVVVGAFIPAGYFSWRRERRRNQKLETQLAKYESYQFVVNATAPFWGTIGAGPKKGRTLLTSVLRIINDGAPSRVLDWGIALKLPNGRVVSCELLPFVEEVSLLGGELNGPFRRDETISYRTANTLERAQTVHGFLHVLLPMGVSRADIPDGYAILLKWSDGLGRMAATQLDPPAWIQKPGSYDIGNLTPFAVRRRVSDGSIPSSKVAEDTKQYAPPEVQSASSVVISPAEERDEALPITPKRSSDPR